MSDGGQALIKSMFSKLGVKQCPQGHKPRWDTWSKVWICEQCETLLRAKDVKEWDNPAFWHSYHEVTA